MSDLGSVLFGDWWTNGQLVATSPETLGGISSETSFGYRPSYDVRVSRPATAALLDSNQQIQFNYIMSGQSLPGYDEWLNTQARIDYSDEWVDFRLNNPEVSALEQIAFTSNVSLEERNEWFFSLGDVGTAAIMNDFFGSSGGSVGPSRDEKISNYVAQISDAAARFGVQLSTDQITEIAAAAVDNNWVAEKITDRVMEVGSVNPYAAGDILATKTKIQSAATDFRLQLDSDVALDLAERFARGEITEQGIDARLRQLAIEANPEYASVLGLGISISAYENTAADVKRVAQDIGLDMSAAKAQELSLIALRDGLDESGLQDLIFAEITNVMDLSDTGQLAANANILKQNAARNLVSLSDQSARDYAVRIAKGEIAEDAVNQLWVDSARARYGFAAGALDRGLSMYDYFLPSMQQIASELEMNVNDIDLSDGNMLSLLVDESGAEPRAMSITESRRAARATNQWQGTQAARNSLSQMVNNISTIFGSPVL